MSPNGILTVYDQEIALVYYRTGYDMENYCFEDKPGEIDEEKWNIRTALECSMAIKCPSVDV